MRILDLYLSRVVLHQTMLVLGVLLGLFLFVTFLDELGNLGVGNYGVLDIFHYVGLTIPRTIYELFPMAALLGTILGLSILANDSELIVMRASGISLGQITGSILKVGALFVLVAVLIGEFVSPTTETMAARAKSSAMQTDIKQKTRFGLWMRDVTTYVNIGEILPDLTLLDVRVFEFDRYDHLRSLVFAGRGSYGGDDWNLQDVRQTVISEDGYTDARRVESAVWETEVTPAIMAVFLVQPDQLSVWQLNSYIDHLRDNNQETGQYELAFWNKVALPLSTAVMVVLAIPFVFGNVRSGAMGRNLLIGILVGLGFYVTNKAFGYIVLVYGVPPLAGAIVPMNVFLIAALVLYRRVV